jgi:predicted metalloprotease with PDZ domain
MIPPTRLRSSASIGVILSASGVLSACPQREQRSRAKGSRVRWGAGAKNLSDSFLALLRKTKRDSSRDVKEARNGLCRRFARRAQNDAAPSLARAPILTLIVCALAVALAPAPARATIRYEISLAHPGEHKFHVTMTIPDTQAGVTVQMPAWNALYQIRDFAYRVSDFHAQDASGAALPVHRLDKETWRIEAPGRSPAQSRSEIRIEYASFWDNPGPFDTQLNDEHAFLNLAMILCYVPQRRGEASSVRFTDIPQGWRVAIELPGGANDLGPDAAYAPHGYDEMVDAPVEIGRFDEWTFSGGGRASGKMIRVVYHGDAVDHAALTRMLSQIVNYETAMMGDAPFPEYTFILHVSQNYGGGGMEHANSAAISVSSFAQLANVSAHEFFHLWNVKRIRPQSLEPVDYTREMWTPALWFAEGVTSTYAAYTLERTGIWNRTQFLADLGSQITELESHPARNWQSAEESSLDTWFDKYPLYDRPDFSISYYNKGQLLGVALDILIREATDNRASLDDVIRRMNQEYAQRGRFYPDSAGIEETVEEVVRGVSGGPADPPAGDFPGFFKRYVGGTEEIPFADLLARAGLSLKTQGEKRAGLGFGVERDSAGIALLTDLDLSSAAAQVGLREGDAVVSLDGAEVPRNLERWLRGRAPGEMARVRIRRGGRESEFAFALGQQAAQVYGVEEMPRPSERQLRIRNGLFQGTTYRPATPR